MSALAAMLLGSSAMAQDSGYGCRGLLTSRALPVIEGEGGQFFRVDPDLMSLNRVPDAAIQDLVHLSRALEDKGTTLIYVPTPTKALAAPHLLPPLAGYLGFDADLAVSVHTEMLRAMRQAGLTVVDARAALRRAGQAEPMFQGPDPRPNRAGQRALAKAVAGRIAQTPGFGALPKTELALLEGAPQPIPSLMRYQLQRQCASELPQVMGRLSAVSPAPGAAAPDPSAGVAVISSDMTGDPGLNFAGFLSEALGLLAAPYHVPGGNAFDAISGYMTSDAFAGSPPRYLVWENPVWQGLGSFGDQPMAELLAAVQGCSLPIGAERSGNRLRLDLSGLPKGRGFTLALDADSDAIREARFHVLTQDGLTRTRSIRRAQGAALTGRFFMPLTGHEALPSRVDIELDAAPGPQMRVSACHTEVQP